MTDASFLPIEADEYDVYSVLIENLIPSEGLHRVVIREETSARADSIEAARKMFPDLPSDLIDDFRERNKEPVTFDRHFSLSTEYVLVPGARIEEILSNHGWQDFFKQFTGAHGYLTLSRVGINEDDSQALVGVTIHRSEEEERLFYTLAREHWTIRQKGVFVREEG